MTILSKISRFLAKLNNPVSIFVFSFLYRLPNITSFVNDDDSLWKYRGYIFTTAMTGLKFADTAVTYHPGVPLMWSQMIAIKTFSILDKLYFHGKLFGSSEFFYNHLIQNVYLLFFGSILITLIYILLRKIVNAKFAGLAISLMLLEPFFISLGRSIHNDLLMSLFTYLGFLSFYLLLVSYKGGNLFKRKITWFIGISSALALLTKSGGLFLVPLYISSICTFIFFKRTSSKRYLLIFSISIALSIIFFCLIWPAMWVNPGPTLWLYFNKGIYDTAIEEGHLHYWFGQLTMDPGPLFYPIVLVGRFTPEFVVFFFLGLIIFTVQFTKKTFKKSVSDFDKFLFLNIVFFLGFFIMLSITSKKLDRYLITEVLPMGVLVTYFIRLVYTKFNKNIVYVTLGILLLYRIYLLGLLHPNYLAYYSPFVGGIENGRYVIEPKWVIGFDKVADYLNDENTRSDHKLDVVTSDAHLLSYFANFDTYYPESSQAKGGDYFVVGVWRPRTAIEMIDKFHLTSATLVKKIYIAGVEYYDIYKNEKPKHIKTTN